MTTDQILQAELTHAFHSQADPLTGAGPAPDGLYRRGVRARRRSQALAGSGTLATALVAVVGITALGGQGAPSGSVPTAQGRTAAPDRAAVATQPLRRVQLAGFAMDVPTDVRVNGVECLPSVIHLPLSGASPSAVSGKCLSGVVVADLVRLPAGGHQVEVRGSTWFQVALPNGHLEYYGAYPKLKGVRPVTVGIGSSGLSAAEVEATLPRLPKSGGPLQVGGSGAGGVG